MLTLKQLNDRSYQNIVDSAKEMIPHIFPQWTDLRAHDPGITFVELFAWLIQMLEEYQNKVTLKNRIKFLKLLGVSIEEPKRATTYVTFDGAENRLLAKGTKIFGEGIVFETCDMVCLKSTKVESVFIYKNSDKKYYKVFGSGQKNNMGYPVFGQKPEIENAMVVGLDNINELSEVSLKINLGPNDWPRNRIKAQEDILPPLVRVSWEYYKDNQWNKFEEVTDETCGFCYSGNIKLGLIEEFSKEYLSGADDKKLYYVRCVLEEGQHEVPPVVHNIYPNAVKANHGDTLSRVYYFSGTGEEELSFEMNEYLAYYGLCEVKVKAQDGFWYIWDEYSDSNTIKNTEKSNLEVYRIDRDSKYMKTTISFGKTTNGRVPAKGYLNIMVTVFDKIFEENREINFERAVPNQIFGLNWANSEDLIYADDFKIQVGNKLPGESKMKWADFERVKDFVNSNGCDRHFVFDYLKREMHFGNNERGAMPGGFGENVIQITSCIIGGGCKGNIKEDWLKYIFEPSYGDLRVKNGSLKLEHGSLKDRYVNSADRFEDFKEKYKGLTKEYTVRNYCAATGGVDGENLEDTEKRMLLDIKEHYRAVTASDYEKLALNTPGLMVARAKALPEFIKGLKNYPEKRLPAQLTVVVVPYGTNKTPMPEKTFMERVRHHLGRCRLITTEIHVVPPTYIGIEVCCTVVVMSHIRFKKDSIVRKLDEFINPLSSKEYTGWLFGGAVRKGDIISKLNEIEGVEYVKDLQLYANGEEIRIDKTGDIYIPPYALAYLKSHDIEIISNE